MDVKKAIADLTSQLSEINYDSEDDNILLKDSYQSALDDNSFETNDKSKLRKAVETITLPENVYGGRRTSRKKIDSFSESSDHEFLKSDEDISRQDDNVEDGEDENSEDVVTSESEEELPTGSNKVNEMVSPSNVQPEKGHKRDCNIYSAASKNVPNDVKKGVAIRNQLRIWESLLECRIKLQKGLAASNNLPPKEQLLEAKSQLDLENQEKLSKCKKNLLCLLGKLTDLQEELLKQSAECNKSKDILPSEFDDEIPSDDSGLENEGGEKEQEEDDQPSRKKRKLNDYSSMLKRVYDNFIPYRNNSIQKWNDKTKVSTGKMANSNFSAFDQSTLKQIEQIMVDKSRLINRTRIKRNNDVKNRGETNEKPQDVSLDPEIFDDTDFYHKLLRDYIERKSVDATNSSNTERQLIELQKLRSKMKRNVDTKSTKGRKLRYVVLPKLINFMAPRPYDTWNEAAETELYNSLFGNIKLS